MTGGQSATFDFTVSVPSGYTATTVNWWVDPQTGDPPAHTGSTFSYKAVGVGKHTITVKVGTSKGLLNGSTSVVAIGGPLQYSVTNKVPDESPYARVPEHDDNLPSQPWFLQYFNYSYLDGPAPAGAQPYQYGRVFMVLSQPTGTTFAWRVEGPATITPTNIPSSEMVTVWPTGESGVGAIKVRLTYNYTDPADSSLTGIAEDDSEETPPPGTSTVNPSFYSFTSHLPFRVEKTTSAPGICYQGGVYPDTIPWSYARYYNHRMYDQNGNGMPGVWMTERFPSAASELSQWNADYGQNIPLQDISQGPTSWMSMIPYPSQLIIGGDLNNADEIALQGISGNAAHPNPGQYSPLVLTQWYMAATRTTTLGAFGILVQVWRNCMGLTSVSHEKN